MVCRMVVVETQAIVQGEVMSYLPRILRKNTEVLIPNVYLTVAIRLQQATRHARNVGFCRGQVRGGRPTGWVSERDIVGFQSSLEWGGHYSDERNGSVEKVILATEP